MERAAAGGMDPKQRRAAIVSGVVLGATAIAIYLIVIVKYFVL